MGIFTFYVAKYILIHVVRRQAVSLYRFSLGAFSFILQDIIIFRLEAYYSVT